MNIEDLIRALQACGNSNVTLNVTVNNAAQPQQTAEETQPDSDFTIGDDVTVIHHRHNGETVTVDGEVIDIAKDDKGWYVRVAGVNGNHYRAGLHYGEERLGTAIVEA